MALRTAPQSAPERRALEGVPVRRILDLAPMLQARVAAGSSGLDRVVRSVNVMEVPDILEWVTADEFLLTTAYPIHEDPAALTRLVPELAARGLAGMAIKPTRYIGAIPQAMIDDAERLGFPLIELPAPASFNEIIGAVLGVILDVQSVRLRRAAEIHDRFTSIVLTGGGLRQISEALAEAIRHPVAIVDAQGPVVATSSGFDDAAAADLSAASALDAAADGGPTATICGSAGAVIVQPIQAGPERHGSIVVRAELADLSDDDLEALDYAATVAALRQVQARAVAEADRRFQAVCLDELVTGHVTDRAALMERAAAFDWDLSTPRAVLVAEIDELGGRPFGLLAGSSEELVARHRLVDAARVALGPSAIVWERTAGVAALVASTARGRDAARASGAELHAEAGRRLAGAVIDVGLGRPVDDPLTLDVSFREARGAISVGRWSRGPGVVSLFEDLHLDRLLFNTAEPERSAFVDAAIRPLLDYDARRHTTLVETLEVYLATRNVADAARRLFVHYNTLTNRLDRIAGIIGPFVDDPERCLELGLALRLRRSPGR
ncbi:MAG TPA: PucR family transcriptional regulator ligand-binding domain-containing protein [Candidatus Limnocylindrales bacterium]|nr:PucR family transcriptional regulator ligand-binding domain-containing protein [Candidatus Limnocylindrales bacterium]